MSNQLNPKTALIIILGSIMASIVAPIFVVIFETHYQQWLENESSPPTTETVPPPEPRKTPMPEPEVATPEPEVTTPQPEVTTPQPEVTTPQPEVTTPQPEVTTPQPEVTKPQPEVTTPQSEVTTPQPEVTTPQPQVTTPQPQVSTLKLDNARLIVKLWLDSPGKTQFKAGDEVKFFYQIDPVDNISTTAYITLFNRVAVNEWAIVVSNEAVETGKLYSLPKGQKVVLRSGKSVAKDTRLRLTAGRKHVIAIVTPKPINWKVLGADIMKGLQSMTVWGLKELVVEVN